MWSQEKLQKRGTIIVEPGHMLENGRNRMDRTHIDHIVFPKNDHNHDLYSCRILLVHLLGLFIIVQYDLIWFEKRGSISGSFGVSVRETPGLVIPKKIREKQSI